MKTFHPLGAMAKCTYLTKKSRKCTKTIRKGGKSCWIHKGQAGLTRKFKPARPITQAFEALMAPTETCVPETQFPEATGATAGATGATLYLNAYNPVHVNRCMECGVDMGNENPRQLCRKWFCENKY